MMRTVLTRSLAASSCLTTTLSANNNTRVMADNNCLAARTIAVFSLKDFVWPGQESGVAVNF